MSQKAHHNKKLSNAQPKSQQIFFLAKRIHFECIDSTNTWAKKHLDQWSPVGVTLVTASEQTKGRGRFKRQWCSPPHFNIYATFCFWFDLQRRDLGCIPQLLALAAAKSIENKGFLPTIKWPNDLLLQGKKVGGILCESIVQQTRRGIVCGIGLNINMPLEILNQIDRPATSLFVEGGDVLEVEEMLELLQYFFLIALEEFMYKGFAPFFSVFQKRSFLKRGQTVRFHDNKNLIEAQFEQLNPDGSVKLRLPNGKSKIFYAGEFLF